MLKALKHSQHLSNNVSSAVQQSSQTGEIWAERAKCDGV